MRGLTLVLLALAVGGCATSSAELERVPSRSQIENFNRLEIADTAGIPQLISLAVDLIKHFEDWKAAAYDDPAGYCTIGYGHLISKLACKDILLGRFSEPLSEAEGATLLEEDTASARSDVDRLVAVDLSDEQFGALSSFVFNVGATRFSTSTLLSRVNDGKFDLAADEFGRWVKAGGEIKNGLVARRACEESLFRSQLTYNRFGRFDRARCVSLGIAKDVGSLIDIDVGE